ncbi:Gamma interferon inducible lysosomal thiol reductase GILT [Corchorus olitorius]|uniref:Gamma interferon inducible lysosomal thiol reductase GILT n=1 Tax=Corchorus olitorius TaxID=93759 RepID=A0A1R3JS30_9ROSI|nr:Gamma interferon inducible lysosomal thiol reductase GILT [Corchorus olitorius]
MAYLPGFFIIVASLPFMLISLSESSLDNSNLKTSSHANKKEKVTLSLYYESLCPYSASFISENLSKIFENDLHTILKLRLVPWGNAILYNDTTECQHGEEECYLNTIQSCVIDLWPHTMKHFNFINCTENRFSQLGPVKTTEDWEEIWIPCSEEFRMSADLIKECYDSGYGQELQLKYANETASLIPPHIYVPWVVVDDFPLYYDYKNYTKYVCEAYKGEHKPKACKDQHLSHFRSSGVAPKAGLVSEFRKPEGGPPPRPSPKPSPRTDCCKPDSTVPKASPATKFSNSAGSKASPRTGFRKPARVAPKASLDMEP